MSHSILQYIVISQSTLPTQYMIKTNMEISTHCQWCWTMNEWLSNPDDVTAIYTKNKCLWWTCKQYLAAPQCLMCYAMVGDQFFNAIKRHGYENIEHSMNIASFEKVLYIVYMQKSVAIVIRNIYTQGFHLAVFFLFLMTFQNQTSSWYIAVVIDRSTFVTICWVIWSNNWWQKYREVDILFFV